MDLKNLNYKVITNEGAKCGFCNKKLKPVGLSYLYANVNHDMVEYERCDCSEAIAFWKQYDSKQNDITINAIVKSADYVFNKDILKYIKNNLDDIIKENQEKAKKKREKKGTSAEEINKMATTSTRNVGTSSSKAKGRAIDAEKEEKIRKAQELAKNAKPGSLTSKANLVNKYNSGVKTEEVIPEKQDNKKKK